jgi:hypothetical protein
MGTVKCLNAAAGYQVPQESARTAPRDDGLAPQRLSALFRFRVRCELQAAIMRGNGLIAAEVVRLDCSSSPPRLIFVTGISLACLGVRRRPSGGATPSTYSQWTFRKNTGVRQKVVNKIKFDDGSLQAVLAEDTIDSEAVVVDTLSVYRKVIRRWRESHPPPPHFAEGKKRKKVTIIIIKVHII